MKYCYVQQVAGKFSDRGSHAAAQGFEELGYEVLPFSFLDLKEEELLLKKNRPLNGGHEVMQLAFQQMGVQYQDPSDYPASLSYYLGRRVKKTTMAEVRAMENFNSPVFIKPVARKAWTPRVLSGKRADNLINFVHVSSDEPIWLCDPVEFVSEWRFYILNKEIVGVGHYGFGDPLVFPDGREVRDMVAQYQDAPASYGLDVGITKGGATLLVEINDSLSLGNYGCRAKQYAKMVLARWNEVVGYKEDVET